MSNALNIRDLGAARKAALEAEARRRGLSAADLVRLCIDEGLARSAAERARAAWIAEATPGIEAEAARLQAQGPSLARFRRPQR
jgi:hypothetical protein